MEELKSDTAIVGLELQQLGLVQPSPEYDFIAQRGRGEASDDPKIFVEFSNFVGLNFKASGNPALRYSWTSQILADPA